LKRLKRKYINSENSEKAPEGFTSNVMTRVRLETLPLTTIEKSWKKNLIPAVSVTVTFLLIASAFLISGSQSDPLTNPLLDLINSLKSSIPEINISSLFRLSVPSVALYVIIGILILTLFDRALYGIFKREK